MNHLTPSKCTQVIAALVEGNFIRATVRVTGVSKNATLRLMAALVPAVALHFMHYNFCRVHQTLRVTPSIVAGIADHIWTSEEDVGLLRENVQKCGLGCC